MDDLKLEFQPELNSPLLILAYRGWNDAGSSATHAVEYLVKKLGGERFGYIDHDEYYDFTQARPYTRPTSEYQRELTWPKNEFYYTHNAGGRDAVLFIGTEPHLRWRRYGQNMVRFAQELGVSQALALGALLADTPHTRPVPLSGGASTSDMGEQLSAVGINGSGYEGPTGILSVVGTMLAEVGIPNGSLWAAVPHYISATPNPRASIAMIRQLDQLYDLGLIVTDLEAQAEVYEAQVESAISGNPEAQQYVRDLEMQNLAEPDDPALDTPRGSDTSEPLDASQAEGMIEFVEEFLRRQQGGNDRER